MSNSREELTGKIIGLGSKSIRKNYYPELKQRIVELNRSLQWQLVLHNILTDVSMCLTVDEVYRKFLDHLRKLSWLDKDDCIFIKYSASEKLSSHASGHLGESRKENIIYASEERTCDQENAVKFPISVDREEIGTLYFSLAPGHKLTESEIDLIKTLIQSILPTLRRISTEQQRASLERQLNTSQKVQALGTLANGIAHDFNNILSSIFGYSELALSETDPSELRYEYLEQILNSAKRAKGLTEQILSFSRMKETEKQPVNLKQNIKDSVKMIRAALPSTISIEMSFPLVSPVIEANPTQLHQVFMNLCTNASHAMNMDGGNLTVALETLIFSENEMLPLEKGSYAHISIKDTGHGMDSETLQHIFDPYFTTKKEGEGTGLGLSVVYGIVSSMKGKINVYSEPGNGTVFHLYFPVSESSETPDNGGSSDTVQYGSEHLMLVDDDSAICNVMKLMLESLGYSVDAFCSPGDAFDKYLSTPDSYDLVLTDMTMPEMTGIELSKKILDRDRKQKIILITGFNDKYYSEDVTGPLFRMCISKPVMKKDLSIAVRSVLDRSG